MQSDSSSSSSIFNPESLLESTYEDQPATNYTPIPEGEYLMRVKDINVRENTANDGSGRKFYVADVQMVVDDESVRQLLNMPEPQARMSLFLDMIPGTTHLLLGQKNANVPLGRLKAACGLKEGRKWSLRHLIDCTCYGKIKHEADRNDPERIYNRVSAVTREPTTKDSDAKRAAA